MCFGEILFTRFCFVHENGQEKLYIFATTQKESVFLQVHSSQHQSSASVWRAVTARCAGGFHKWPGDIWGCFCSAWWVSATATLSAARPRSSPPPLRCITAVSFSLFWLATPQAIAARMHEKRKKEKKRQSCSCYEKSPVSCTLRR